MKPKKTKTSRKPGTSKAAGLKPVRRTPRGPRTPLASEDLHLRIARRAYEIYELRIRLGPLDDWLKAERDVLGHMDPWDPERQHRGGHASREQE